MSELSETQFHHLVHTTLHDLEEQVLEIEVDGLDVLPTPGVITIELPGGGPFVLSQQTPTRELWLSANYTAAHYARRDGAWHDTQTQEELYAALARLLTERLNTPVTLGSLGT